MSREFQEFLLQINDSRDLPPGEISAFLNFLNELVCELNLKIAPEEERLLPVHLDKMGEVIGELSNNFFPMSHSSEPLKRLAIVEKDKILELYCRARALHERSKETSVFAEEMRERIERLSDDVRLY
jgi:hypothetical protein